MFHEPDPKLARLFAETREPLEAEQFLRQLSLTMERARRVRLLRQSLAALAAAGIVLLNLPWVLEKTAAVVRFTGELAPHTADWLVTPEGWSVSLLVGAWVILRARSAGR